MQIVQALSYLASLNIKMYEKLIVHLYITL